MSFIKNIFLTLIILITLFDLFKSKTQILKMDNTFSFLIEQYEKNLNDKNNTIINKFSQNVDTNSLASIKFLNSLNNYKETGNFTANNEGFKIRCFWFDSVTMRVFDLSQLKTVKYFSIFIYPFYFN